MGWRFRKSFTVVPGLRLNLSKSGLSASIGGAPFTLNVGPRGLMGTASIPGSGISYRQHLSNGTAHIPDSPVGYGAGPVPVPVPGSIRVPLPTPTVATFVNTAPIEEI